MKILLISGHGAGDVGAQCNGYQEYALTRELVNIIAPKLRNYASVDVYDQNRNAFYDCQNGVFNIGAYDYVLEIHFNAFNLSAHGTECFVVPEEQGITVEQEIMQRMGKYFTLRDNDNIFDGVKKTRFLVINTVKQRGISGALLETCFIDSKSDMDTYLSNKDRIASDIVEGIAVGFGLKEGAEQPTPTPKPTPTPPQKTIDTLAREVIASIWGVGQDRINRLTNAGYSYDAIQQRVNQILGGGVAPSKKSIDIIAREIINLPNYGGWGTGQDRMNKLKSAGYDANAVQARINQLLS